MTHVSIGEFRNHGREVVERVEAGEQLTITRSGRPVAELRPVRRRSITAATLLERWSKLPSVDPAALRRDLDRRLDNSL